MPGAQQIDHEPKPDESLTNAIPGATPYASTIPAIVPGTAMSIVSSERHAELAGAYDQMMTLAAGPNYKVASTTTGQSDVLNYGLAFDDIFLIRCFMKRVPMSLINPSN
jgi:hypothetical protein